MFTGVQLVKAMPILALCLPPGLIGQTGTSDRSIPVEPAKPLPFARYVPMTQAERFRTYLAHTFSPESFLRAAAGAGLNQWKHTPQEWGQGAKGYGRRLASVYGEHVVQATSVYGLGAVLHEDNRYFESGEHGFGNRVEYAVESSFLARRDDGSRRLSFSRIASYAIAAGVSREWQPRSTRTMPDAIEAFGIAIAVETGFNVAREFLPRVFHAHPPVR